MNDTNDEKLKGTNGNSDNDGVSITNTTKKTPPTFKIIPTKIINK